MLPNNVFAVAAANLTEEQKKEEIEKIERQRTVERVEAQKRKELEEKTKMRRELRRQQAQRAALNKFSSTVLAAEGGADSQLMGFAPTLLTRQESSSQLMTLEPLNPLDISTDKPQLKDVSIHLFFERALTPCSFFCRSRISSSAAPRLFPRNM